MTTNPIRIIIADDHSIFREGVEAGLRKQTQIQIVAQADNGKELIELAEKHKPDVVVTDIKMPVMDGIKATSILTRMQPALGVIALSMFDEDTLVMDMLEAGARGYLLKNASRPELETAITTVYRRGTYLCNSSSSKLVKLVGRSSFNPFHPGQKPHFSDREIQVIRLICAQFCSKEIGKQLEISSRTVESTRDRIMEKIGARNVVGVVLYAVKHGIYVIE